MSLKVSITPEMLSKPFAFTANCKELEASILKCTATLASSPSGSKNFIVLATKSKEVLIAATGTDTFVVLKVPRAKAESSGCFGFEPDKLLGLIKGRSDMEFRLNKSQKCEFKLLKGQYRGDIVTLPLTEELVSIFNSVFSYKESKSSVSAEFSPETLDYIREGLTLTAVKDVFNNTPLLSHISFKQKTIEISTLDNHHFGFYTVPSNFKGKDFSIAAPLSHFTLIDKLVSVYGDAKESVIFSLQKDTLRAESTSFIAILPLMQADEKSFQILPTYLSSIGKVDFKTSVDADEMAVIVDNLFTLVSPNAFFEFEVKSKSENLRITFTTPSGSASDAFKIGTAPSKTVSCKVVPAVFKDVIMLARTLNNVSYQVKNDKCVLLKCKSKLDAVVTFGCTLH